MDNAHQGYVEEKPLGPNETRALLLSIKEALADISAEVFRVRESLTEQKSKAR